MDYLYYLFMIFGFLAVVLFIEGLFLAWRSYRGTEAKHISRRLQAMSAEHDHISPSLIKQRLYAESPALDNLLKELPGATYIDKLIQQSGMNLNVAKFIGLSLVAALAGVLVAMQLGMPLVAGSVFGLLAASMPMLYLQGAKHNRVIAMEQQLPDALDLMARAMKAGHAFPSALKMVGDEMPEPIASEFRTVFEEINYGISVQESLNKLIARMPSTDLGYFVIAVLIQRETGGNLTELLGNISHIIRERLKLLGTVRVLSAEGRISAWILTILPFVLAFVLQLINPKFLSVLWTDPLGLKMVGFALLMMIIGIYAMWRIIKIRV